MRMLSQGFAAFSVGALLAGAAVPTADAAPRWGGGAWHGGAWHGGGWRGGGWNRGGWGGGWWGPAVVGGLATGAIVGSLAAPYAYGDGYGGCYRYQPVYDAYGVFIGNQPVKRLLLTSIEAGSPEVAD